MEGNRSSSQGRLGSDNSFGVYCPAVDTKADERRHGVVPLWVQELQAGLQELAVQAGLVRLQPGKMQGSSEIKSLVN